MTHVDDIEPAPLEPFAKFAARLRAELDGEFLGCAMLTTVTRGPISRSIRFAATPTADLRSLLRPIGADVGRAQLLALARNRWPCGYWIETEDPFPQHTNEIAVRPPL